MLVIYIEWKLQCELILSQCGEFKVAQHAYIDTCRQQEDDRSKAIDFVPLRLHLKLSEWSVLFGHNYDIHATFSTFIHFSKGFNKQ